MRYILCIILTLCTACCKASDIVPYEIEGIVQDRTTAGYAYLYIAATSLQPSMLVNAPINNSHFIIRGSVKLAEGKYSVARLFISRKAGMKLNEYSGLLQKGKLLYRELVLEPRISITVGPAIEASTLKAGKLNDDYNKLQEITRDGLRRNDSLRQWYRASIVKNKKNVTEAKKTQQTYYRLLSEQRDRQTSDLLNFIANNPSSMLALEKLDLIASIKNNSWRKFMKDFERLLSLVPEKWLQSATGKAMILRVKALKASQQLLPGAILPDYVFRDGKDSVAVRDFRSKYLLLHFWASWSENCRHVQNELEEAFDNYQGKGLTILQISLDASIENWKTALPEDGVAWKQVRCKEGWNVQVERTFEIYGMPTNYLVDQNGTIISSDLWGKELKDKLAEVMH